ncbi:hypothetical protein [Streptomyces tibetensis]|uniref:hypothetical protein n=1 Tax=Streptomyces tibetensis TaxID=2382123 RepID=UPI0033DAED2E
MGLGPVSAGAVVVEVPAGGRPPSVADADGVRLTEGDGLGDAAPDVPSEPPGRPASGASGLAAGPVSAGDAAEGSPAVGSVRPRSPPRAPPEEPPVKETPAMSTAADTAPTAPAATATRRDRRAGGLRRARRPAPARPPGAGIGTTGSSRVSPTPSERPGGRGPPGSPG